MDRARVTFLSLVLRCPRTVIFYFSLSTQSGRSVRSLLSEPAAICIVMLSNT